jgi:hypothetical protein
MIDIAWAVDKMFVHKGLDIVEMIVQYIDVDEFHHRHPIDVIVGILKVYITI